MRGRTGRSHRLMLFLVATLTGVLGASACGGPVRACTLIGVPDGVSIQIPQALSVTSGTVEVKVCDREGCLLATPVLKPESEPSEQVARVSWKDLGGTFDPGTVRMTAVLHGPSGTVVARSTQDLALRREQPNGKECDGDGGIAGEFAFRPGDRVASSSE